MDALITVELEVFMEPIPEGTMINLYDHDLLGDDHLQSEPFSQSGKITFCFHSSRFQKRGLIKENHPDLYFQIVVNDKLIYTSPTVVNVDLAESGTTTKEGGYLVQLGKFFID